MAHDPGGMEDIEGHRRFLENFHEVVTDAPVTLPPLPTGIHANISRWLQCNEHSECFLAADEGRVLLSVFYCLSCGRWIRLSNTYNHITTHYRSCIHNESQFEERYHLSKERNLAYTIQTLRFLLYNGLPFSLSEDMALRKVVPLMPHRAVLRSFVTKAADLVRRRIRDVCSTIPRCVLTFDEWSDKAHRRFLGLTLSGHHDGLVVNVFLGVHDLSCVMANDRLTGDNIADMAYNVANDFAIQNSIVIVVTDRGADMTSAVRRLSRKIGRELIHGNCICHCINSILGKFVELLGPRMDDIIQLRAKLNTLTFSSFLEQRNCRYKSVPSYVSVRWYSLFRMLKVLDALQGDIIDYFDERRELGRLNGRIFQDIKKMLPVIDICKRITKTLESEKFGTLGLVIGSLRTLREQVFALSEALPQTQEILRTWAEYTDGLIRETKENWSGLLEMACILHPSVDHRGLLTSDEITRATHEIRMIMNFYGYHSSSEQVQETDKRSFTDDNELDVLTIIQPQAVYAQNDELGRYYATKGSTAIKAVDFWAERTDLPFLRKVALDILGIIPSSAGSERTFSVAGRVEGLRRLSLSSSSLEDATILMMNPHDLVTDEDMARILRTVDSRFA